MKGLTLVHLAAVCGGILHLPEGREELALTTVTQIVTDSRKAEEGSLFAAIKGERVDGHTFIPQVFAQGALCVLTEHDLQAEEVPAGDHAWIRVRSTLQALKDIAEAYLRILQVPVVGITGSVGKTSTKEMIASILEQKYNVLKTAGNFNNELGLPLTVFRLREEHEIAVLEMGISDFGEMHRLAKIARPDICVITNIGQCHLEFLKSRDGILQAKTEIFDFLKPDGQIILNGCDDKLSKVKNVSGIIPEFFGLRERQVNPFGEEAEIVDWPELSVYADEIQGRGLRGVSCRIHTPAGDFTALIPIPGEHMVMNALAGTSVGLAMGLTLEQIKAGIESLEAVSGRFHLMDGKHCTIIDDCYNANPVSMKSSLKALDTADTRKAAILGDMFELGEEELAMHESVGTYIAELNIDTLICIGTRCKALAEGAEKACSEQGKQLVIRHFETLDAFLEELKDMQWDEKSLLKEGDTVLVKASHGMLFTKIVEALA